MLNELLIGANGVISVCYFTIAFLILRPFLRGEQKTSLVLATILVFFSCALGHGGHLLMLLWDRQHLAHYSFPLVLKLQVGIDSITAVVAVAYIALRRYFSFLVDAPLLLTQAQAKLELANTQLKHLNTKLESLVQERTLELEKTNQELQSSKDFLQLLINVLPQAVVWKDRNSVCLGCNQKFATIAGVASPQDVIGKTDYDFAWTREEAQFLRVCDKEVMQTGKAQLHIIRQQHLADKTTAWMDICKLPLFDKDGNVIGMLAVSEDITERKASADAIISSEAQLKQKATLLEATLTELQNTQVQLIQSEKMSALGLLVAGVAHEINNPVNFIYANLSYASEYFQDLISLLDCYKREYPNPSATVLSCIEKIDYDYLISDLPKLLTSMIAGAERIREITFSLRTFSRLDEAAIKKVDIHKGLDSTLLILHNRLKTKAEAEIKVIKNYALLPQVDCYPSLLNQVFLNILSNAIEALETIETASQTVPTIEIQTELAEDKQVIIKITDNGSGIPKHVQQNIFDPFFTTKPVGQGTGLGLAISYKIIVDTHGGSLQFESRPGRTEFIIAIPLVQEGVS